MALFISLQQIYLNMSFKPLFLPIIFILIFQGAVNGQKERNKSGVRSDKYLIKPELVKHFTDYGYTGSFLMFDIKQNSYTCCNPERCKQRISPASTFKIFNSLVALETGIASDANLLIKWDSASYPIREWNRDHTLQTAFRHSAVWYYQELARRIGEEKMKYHLEKENYGNKDMSGGLDRFWLESTLKISPEEQVAFLINFYRNRLPSFSARSVETVKDIMLTGDTSEFKLRAKTGSAIDTSYLGWYVGYLEKDGNAFIFATTLESGDPDDELAFARRKEITLAIFKDLKIIE